MGLATFNSSCGVYSFADVSIPDSIKTIRVNFLENRAPYVNPQLSPALTDRVKQKIINLMNDGLSFKAVEVVVAWLCIQKTGKLYRVVVKQEGFLV